jgi:hypothetical protein
MPAPRRALAEIHDAQDRDHAFAAAVHRLDDNDGRAFLVTAGPRPMAAAVARNASPWTPQTTAAAHICDHGIPAQRINVRAHGAFSSFCSRRNESYLRAPSTGRSPPTALIQPIQTPGPGFGSAGRLTA